MRSRRCVVPFPRPPFPPSQFAVPPLNLAEFHHDSLFARAQSLSATGEAATLARIRHTAGARRPRLQTSVRKVEILHIRLETRNLLP